MSTSYRPLVDLNYKDLKKKCTDIEFVKHENSINKWGEILHKDGNWLHFHEFKNKVCGFTRYGMNDVDFIIRHMEQVMNVPIYDEYSKAYEVLSFQDMDEEEKKEFLSC